MYYCGLDLGKKSSHFCVMNGERKIVERGQVRNRVADLTKRFGELPPMRVVIEASTKAFWLADFLEELGHDVAVVDPGKTKAIGAARIKHDKLDAKILAELCAADILALVDRPNRKQRLDRMIVASRDLLVRSRGRLAMSVRSLLDSEGIELKSCAVDRIGKALEHIRGDIPDEIWTSIEPLLASLESLTEQIAECDTKMEAMLGEDPDMKRLKTAPGVGTIVAAAYLMAVRDAKRFGSGRQVGAYLGLVPSLYQSGKAFKLGRITKRGNKQARWLLCVAANALLRTKQPSALKSWGLELVERLGRKKAIVAIARKLSSVLWSMLKNGRDFEPRLLEMRQTKGQQA